MVAVMVETAEEATVEVVEVEMAEEATVAVEMVAVMVVTAEEATAAAEMEEEVTAVVEMVEEATVVVVMVEEVRAVVGLVTAVDLVAEVGWAAAAQARQPMSPGQPVTRSSARWRKRHCTSWTRTCECVWCPCFSRLPRRQPLRH